MSGTPTSTAFRRARVALALAGILAVGAPAAVAATREARPPVVTGGLAIPGAPDPEAAGCSGLEPWTCARGQVLRIRGESLQSVRTVVFEGARGARDDARVKVRGSAARRGELLVVVPRRARTGRLRIVSSLGFAPRTSRRLRVLTRRPATDDAAGFTKLVAGGRRKAVFRYEVDPAKVPTPRVEAVRVRDGRVVRRWDATPDDTGAGEVRWDGFIGDRPARRGAYVLRLAGPTGATASASVGSDAEIDLLEGVFPIRGRHRLASSRAQRFGGGRGHQGTDNFAKCGTPLAAWTKGVVQFVGSHGAAGNYVVVRRPNGQSYAYMHMRSRARVSVGDRVFAGQRLGRVGSTGRASECHLHFEAWTAPGWQRGGAPYDPGPLLRRLEAGGRH